MADPREGVPVTAAEDPTELRDTVAHVAIGRLLGHYADVIDRRAFGELDDLFLPDCEITVDARRGDPTVLTGAAGLAAFLGPAMDRFEFFQFVILSHRTWIEGDDEASGRLHLCELRQDRGTGRRSQAFGVYHDRFRRVDGRWRFAERRYHSLGRTSPDDDGRLEVFPFPDR